jgi:leader peptidase (prepilin peptidase)/N-methyltransferase
VVAPRSACPSCHVPIAAYDNIPVVSWLVLGGRCRHCHQEITPRYAVVELMCGMLFLLSFMRASSLADAAKGCALCFLLLGLTFTDAETHLLPDALTLPGLGIALVFSYFSLVPGPAYHLFPMQFRGEETQMAMDLQLAWRSLLNALMGALLGSGFLYLIAWVYLKVRKVEGMGLGDVKLMAMAGAFLGPVLTLFVLCTASLLGGAFGVWILFAVYRQRITRYRAKLGEKASARSWKAAQLALRCLEIPYGVFLCMMSIVTWFFGAEMIRAYLGLFQLAG